MNMAGQKKFQIEKEGNIAVLTIKTSEKINQFSVEAHQELLQVFSEIEKDNSISVLIITGHGKAFAAGANINQMSEMNQEQGFEFAKLGQSVFDRVESLSCVTIAAINGAAVGGGCELSLACDYRIAVEDAKLGQPEINLGTIPGWGGCYRLPRLVGLTAARDMILTGKIISAREAFEINLVDKVVKGEELLNESKILAQKLLRNSPLILRYAKQAFSAGITMSKQDANLKEAELFGLSFASEDRKEGMSAFLEKREPRFTGK